MPVPPFSFVVVASSPCAEENLSEHVLLYPMKRDQVKTENYCEHKLQKRLLI